MNPSHPNDLQERICRLLDGEMQQDEANALDAELRSCPDSRALYLQLATLHSTLECQFNSRSAIHPDRIIPIDLFLSRQRKRIVRIALLTAAAVLALAVIPMWLKETKGQDVLASFQTTADTKFHITHSEKFSASEGQILHPGSVLKLESGRLEAKFSSGARCIIQAPCELRAIGDDHVQLQKGLAWFHVPPEAHGFKVETHQLQIIDLGTEFGVVVKENGLDEIHVTKGSVEASVLNSNKTQKPQIITSGHARKINQVSELTETPLRASLFPTRLFDPLAIVNANFDTPPEDLTNYDSRGYGPISAWGTSGKGIGISDASQPFLNGQAAHSGTHAAFIQGEGLISQSLSGFDPSKKYTITYFVNERGLPNASTSTAVSVDLGTTLYKESEPIRRTDAFRRIVSDPLDVFGPTANIEIRGQKLTGDASLLIDSVSISRSFPKIPDSGFEHPILTAKSFNQNIGQNRSSSWLFTAGAGITTNQSAFGSANAPEGSQAAVLQGKNATIETTLHDFEPGNLYRLCFHAAGRKGGSASLRVTLDGNHLIFDGLEEIKPNSTDYLPFTSVEFKATSESHTLRIQSTSEGTTFLDDLHLEFIAEADETQ